jgi:hypothetical protein
MAGRGGYEHVLAPPWIHNDEVRVRNLLSKGKKCAPQPTTLLSGVTRHGAHCRHSPDD